LSYLNLNDKIIGLGVRAMVLNATFNNISGISWQSVLLVEATRVSRENHRPVTSHWQTLSHYVVSITPHLTVYIYIYIGRYDEYTDFMK